MKEEVPTRKAAYDLAVAYRICPKLSATANGFPFDGDKFVLVNACLNSFVAALGPVRAKIWFVLDGCPAAYAELCRRRFDPEQVAIVETPGIGNRGTFNRQVDILREQRDAETVYFAEDDYLYVPNTFGPMISFLRSVSECDFITPYDHPDCYTLDLHRSPKWMRLFEGHHWRTAASTCLTFMTRRSTLASTETTFRSYGRGNFDASLWLSLTKAQALNPLRFLRYGDLWQAKIVAKAWANGWRQILFGKHRQLWAPIPGFATHLDDRALSPGVDWPARLKVAMRDRGADEQTGRGLSVTEESESCASR